MRTKEIQPATPEELTEAIAKAKELNGIKYIADNVHNRIIKLLESALKNPQRLKKGTLQIAAAVAKKIITIHQLLSESTEKRSEVSELLKSCHHRSPKPIDNPPTSE